MWNESRKPIQCMTKVVAVLAIFCLALMSAPSAKADPITGEVAFIGGFTATGGSGPTDLANATGVAFSSGIVGGSTGDFASYGVGMYAPVSLTSFTFAPFSGPVDPLWSVGIFEFTLNTVDVVSQSATSLVLAGNGIVSTTVNVGLDATAFGWSFSGDNSGGTLQLFSSTASPTAVAEPSEAATLGFLALSMMAFVIWSRKPRKLLQQ